MAAPLTNRTRRWDLPELPEAEIWRRRLARWGAGRRLAEVSLPDPGAIRPTWSTRPSQALADGAAALQALLGATAGAPCRHGKRLGWRFGDRALGIHLGMSGAWVHGDRPAHARVGLRLGEDWLWFRDPRRFGCLVPVPAASLEALLRAGHGPDALDAPPDGPGLAARCRTATPIKVALMDQGRIAGLGNIHAVEALWRAGLHPARPARDLSPAQWEALAAAIPAQLHAAIAAQGEGELRYLTEGGPNPFAVYGRADAPCPRCRTPIRRARLGGRATFWCPTCQPEG